MNLFISIPGVSGEVTEASFKGTISDESFQWAISKATSASNNGGGAGKVSFSDFTITKVIDRASTALFNYAATGRRIPSMSVIITRTVQGKDQPYLIYQLSQVYVTGISQSSSGEAITESVSFALESVKLQYRALNIDGRFGPATTASYDVLTQSVPPTSATP